MHRYIVCTQNSTIQWVPISKEEVNTMEVMYVAKVQSTMYYTCIVSRVTVVDYVWNHHFHKMASYRNVD